MRKHQLVSLHVKFELVYISSLSKSIACTEQVSYRSDLSQQQHGELRSFLGQDTLLSQCLSPPGIKMSTGKLYSGGNPMMDLHPIQEV